MDLLQGFFFFCCRLYGKRKTLNSFGGLFCFHATMNAAWITSSRTPPYTPRTSRARVFSFLSFYVWIFSPDFFITPAPSRRNRKQLWFYAPPGSPPSLRTRDNRHHQILPPAHDSIRADDDDLHHQFHAHEIFYSFLFQLLVFLMGGPQQSHRRKQQLSFKSGIQSNSRAKKKLGIDGIRKWGKNRG